MGGLFSFVLCSTQSHCFSHSLFSVVTFPGFGLLLSFASSITKYDRRTKTGGSNKTDKREILYWMFLDDDDDNSIFVSLESRRFFQIIYKHKKKGIK